MDPEGSITRWILGTRAGDPTAIRALWQRYFPQLVALARDKLRGTPCKAADEEDVALSALDSFFHAAQEGRFPDLADRHDLWRLLFWITARKVIDLRRREGRQPPLEDGELEQVIGDGPTPEFAAAMAEEYRRLLEKLGHEHLRTIAVAKMEGYSNAEIAQRLDCSVRTVERGLHLIRRNWEPDGETDRRQ